MHGLLGSGEQVEEVGEVRIPDGLFESEVGYWESRAAWCRVSREAFNAEMARYLHGSPVPTGLLLQVEILRKWRIA